MDQNNQPPQQPGGPQQPYQPYPPQQPWGTPPPQPPKKSKGKILGLGCLGIIGLFVIIGIITAVAGGGSDSNDKASDTAKSSSTADDNKTDAKKDDKPADSGSSKKSAVEQFQACVAKTGSPNEKAAVKHVTKVTGVGEQNNILDSAEVFTDYTGGFMSANAGDAKLIASAFGSCYKSKNGLVTVYGADGDMIANGNF